MSDYNLTGLLIACAAWLALTLFAGTMFVKTRKMRHVLHIAMAITFLFALENALFILAELYHSLAAMGRLTSALSSAVTTDTLLGLGFLISLLLLLLTHPSVLPFRKASAEEEAVAEKESDTSKQLTRLRRRNTLLRLTEKIERLYLLDLPPDTLLRDALEQISNHEGFLTVWCGFANEKGDVEPFFISDKTVPPFLYDEYGVSQILSEAEANNPSEYAYSSGMPHLYSNVSEAPMNKQCYKRLQYSMLSSVISIPLFYPDSQHPDGVLTIYTTGIPYTEEDEILDFLVTLMQRLMLYSDRYQAFHTLKKQVERLKSSEAMLHNIITALPVRVYWKNTELVYEGCNRLFSVDAGEHRCENIIGKTDHHLVWAEYAESLEKNDLKVINSGQEQTNQLEKQHNLWRLSNRAPLKDVHGNIVGVLGAYIDFTLQQRAFDYHEEKEQQFRSLLDQMPTIAIQGFDKNRKINYWNRQSEILYGLSSQEAIGKNFETTLLPESQQKPFVSGVSNWLHHDEKMMPVVQQHLHKNKHSLTVKTARILLDRTGDAPQFYSIDVDLTRQKEAETKLKKLADFDALTHLPNRHFLNRHLVELLKKTERSGGKFAIFFIDLDNFKYINDTYGHHFGDELLIESSARLKSVLREYDFFARFGGDEFIVTLEYGSDDLATSHIASKMIRILEEPFTIYDKDLYVSASIGIALYPENSYKLNVLLKQADTAMYKAKKLGKNRFAYFSEEFTAEMSEQLHLETAMRKSFQNNEIYFVFQPQVDIKSRQIVSCEALARWTNPETQQPVPTGTFLPIIQRINLMPELTRRAIDAAIDLLQKWREKEIPLIRIDINLTSSILQNEEIFTHLKERLTSEYIRPEYIGIEITETQLIELNDPISERILKSLDDFGIHISIDDFGTGYSSLSYLSRLTVDTVKIDKSFIDLADDERSQAVIRSIIAMSHELQYDVVAEGVETEDQTFLLDSLGCDKIQGNHFFRPLLADTMTEQLQPRATGI